MAFRSPTSFTLGQQPGIIADWAIKNGSKKAVSILSDWAPGAEAGKVFAQHFTEGAASCDTLKVRSPIPVLPLPAAGDDLHPDTLLVFVPARQAGPFARRFAKRGLDKSQAGRAGPYC
jgi:branched-chain amino acid transport system substrate-binding protein